MGESINDCKQRFDLNHLQVKHVSLNASPGSFVNRVPDSAGVFYREAPVGLLNTDAHTYAGGALAQTKGLQNRGRGRCLHAQHS